MLNNIRQLSNVTYNKSQESIDILNAIDKAKLKFGDGISDYGRLSYNLIFLKEKTARIDIFNGNYSLFRGLSVSFLLITIMCGYFFSWQITALVTIPFFLSISRMIRFAKYYATETFRTFYNIEL